MMVKIQKPSNSEEIIYLNKCWILTFLKHDLKGHQHVIYDAKESEKFDDLTFSYNKFQILSHYHVHEM